MTPCYTPRRLAEPLHLPIRGLDYRGMRWRGSPDNTRPLLVMLHGFMDVGASFQFVVDAMHGERDIVAPDWRGFGGTQPPTAHDAYWFPDYLGDLDALLDALSPERPVDLLGHSMGGNIAMSYAGVRPVRIRRLINLEGFGMPDAKPEDAPQRLAQWLDELRRPYGLKPYPNLRAVAARLQDNNPRLPADKAAWLASHWSERGADRLWHLRADAAHRRRNPVPYRAAEAVAMWSRITAPLLWVQGTDTRLDEHWRGRYSLAEFNARLDHVPQVQRVTLTDAGHMLHHDQPLALAARIDAFLA